MEAQHLNVTVQFPRQLRHTRDVFHVENPCLARTLEESGAHARIWCVVDGGVAAANPALCEAITAYALRYRRSMTLLAPPLVVPGGEAVKNDPAHVAQLHRHIHELRMDRHAFLLVVGGGAVLDMAGYAASVAHRGLRVVRIPTTTVAQADCAVGVKNGINAFGRKDFLGTYAPPWAVVIDAEFTKTLSPRDRRCGLAEALKIALTRDASFYRRIEAWARELHSGQERGLDDIVQRSAQLHLELATRTADPFELATARPLQFGHWAAHALEMLSRHTLRHGEAVAIGMALDTAYAYRTGLCTRATLDSVVGTLKLLGFTLDHPAMHLRSPSGEYRLLDALRDPQGAPLNVPMLSEIGVAVDVDTIHHGEMAACISALPSLWELA